MLKFANTTSLAGATLTFTDKRLWLKDRVDEFPQDSEVPDIEAR